MERIHWPIFCTIPSADLFMGRPTKVEARSRAREDAERCSSYTPTGQDMPWCTASPGERTERIRRPGWRSTDRGTCTVRLLTGESTALERRSSSHQSAVDCSARASFILLGVALAERIRSRAWCWTYRETCSAPLSMGEPMARALFSG